MDEEGGLEIHEEDTSSEQSGDKEEINFVTGPEYMSKDNLE